MWGGLSLLSYPQSILFAGWGQVLECARQQLHRSPSICIVSLCIPDIMPACLWRLQLSGRSVTHVPARPSKISMTSHVQLHAGVMPNTPGWHGMDEGAAACLHSSRKRSSQCSVQ